MGIYKGHLALDLHKYYYINTFQGDERMYEYEKRKIDFTSGYFLRGRRYRCSIIKFPTLYHSPAKGTEIVELYLFRSRRGKSSGSALILHGLGSRNIPFFLKMGAHLSAAGITTGILILPYNYTRTKDRSMSGKDFLEIHTENAVRAWDHAVVDTLSTVDLLESMRVWSDNNVLIGYCLGGMVAVIVAALDRMKRFSRLVLMTTGGGWHHMIWKSPISSFVKRRLPWDREEMKRLYERLLPILRTKSSHEILNENVPTFMKYDPLVFAHSLDSNRVRFIDALFDRALPYSSRKDLWRDLGKPRKRVIPIGHVTWLPFEYIFAKWVIYLMGLKVLPPKEILEDPLILQEPEDPENHKSSGG